MKEYKFRINGKEYSVTVDGIHDSRAKVNVNGVDYTVDVDSSMTSSVRRDGCDVPTALRSPLSRVEGGTSPKTEGLTVNQDNVDSPGSKLPPGMNSSAAGSRKIEAPLPGVIIGVHATPGQSVKRGQRLAVLEAMKMENDILSPIDGTVQEIHVQRGDSVLEGATIAMITPIA